MGCVHASLRRPTVVCVCAHAPYAQPLEQGKAVVVNGEEKKGKLRNFVETIDLQVRHSCVWADHGVPPSSPYCWAAVAPIDFDRLTTLSHHPRHSDDNDRSP